MANKYLDLGCDYADPMTIADMRKFMQLLQIASEAGYTHVITFDETSYIETAIDYAHESVVAMLNERISKRSIIISDWVSRNPGILVTEMPDDLLKGLE